MQFTGKEIKLDRELSDLDKFAIDFIKILRKYTKYVIISGYVSILLGRSRSSEDVDIIVPKIEFVTFQNLAKNLIDSNFYCLNTENVKEMYEYLLRKTAIRFAKNNTIIPNIELKFAKNKIDDLTLAKTITVKLNKETLIISHLELQVAFKEEVLKSPKDKEDARHIKNVIPLDENLIKKYKGMLREFY